jgi:enamine deaminase RidA (YjgF/YER057c/UK114 family)
MAASRGRVERRLAELGLELPHQPVPVGNYLPAARVGNLVFTSGQTARINGVRRYVGVVGQEVSEADAYLSARDAMLNCLACVKQAVGSLDRVTRVVKVIGFVNVGPEFVGHPTVINGASDLLRQLFDETAVIAHCRHGLANYKVPARVFAIDDFPKTPSPNGLKIQRTKLRDMAEGLLNA